MNMSGYVKGKQRLSLVQIESIILKIKTLLLETHDEDDERFKEHLQEGRQWFKQLSNRCSIYKAKKLCPGAEPELEQVVEDSIQMNKPLKFDGYTVISIRVSTK